MIENNPRLSYAGVGGDSADSGKTIYRATSQGSSATDDFGAFESNEQRPRRAPEPGRGGQNNRGGRDYRGNYQAKRRPPQRNNPTNMLIAAAAVIAVIFLVVLIIVAIASSGGDITLENNAYVAYADGSGSYHVAVNGTDIGSFENTVSVTPAADMSFAYVTEFTPDGYKLSYIEGKKINDITIDGVAEVLCFADYTPGVVYQNNGIYYLYTVERGEELITKDPTADNFLISGDASTVVYNQNDSEGVTWLMSFSNEANTKRTKVLEPVAVSADGSLIYGYALSSKDFVTQMLFVVDEEDNRQLVFEGFDRMIEMNTSGDEIIFAAPTNGSVSSFVYRFNEKNPDKYEAQRIGRGYFETVKIDNSIVCYDSFKDTYVRAFEVPTAEGESEITDGVGAIYHIAKSHKAPTRVSGFAGQFSPDGDYYYYVNNESLYQIDLGKKDLDTKEIYADVLDFAVTAKGDIYTLDKSEQLRFHKTSSSSAKTSKVASNVAAIKMHDYSNTLYFSTTDDLMVYTSENGSTKPANPVKFDSTTLSALPSFSNYALKKSFAAFKDEATGDWKLYYTSNGSTFKTISSGCTQITNISE